MNIQYKTIPINYRAKRNEKKVYHLKNQTKLEKINKKNYDKFWYLLNFPTAILFITKYA